LNFWKQLKVSSRLIHKLILSFNFWEDGLYGNLSFYWRRLTLIEEKSAKVLRKPSSQPIYRLLNTKCMVPAFLEPDQFGGEEGGLRIYFEIYKKKYSKLQ
jgi:hypothetical protein